MAPVIYQDRSQWIVSRWWYWKNSDAPDSEAHGPYPFKWLARIAATLGGGR